MCNSDKFSLLLNLQYMQESQKKIILDYLNAEMNQLEDLVKDKESSDPSFSQKTNHNTYNSRLISFC